ncbi:MAG: carboxypeptidase-like regulatory domain-containing protein [Maribacter sp.]|nr:carboxypeptidase-like regulatory domain-containing protein [Maribacter sp.]NNK19209.1 carboxypeptidase-like regulatory domain-containing protein [Maribacter sp.]
MKKLILFFLLCFTTLGICAQNEGIIQGKIIDLEFNNEPVLHANVQVKDTNISTQTNFNGNFEIKNLETGSYVLEVSFAGYDTVEIPVDIVANHVTRIDQGLIAKSIDLSALLAQTNSKASSVTTSDAEQSFK